ncbi:MAG: PAS domain-containing protein, partial [Thermodesulfobacteriota bacterium]
MTNVENPNFKFKDQLTRLSEKVDQLAARTAVQQTTAEALEMVAEIRRVVKDCEREWTKAADILEGEIQKLRLENEMLQAKGALHEAVFENSDDGIVITSKTGNFLAVNQGFVRLVGCKTKEEVLARKIQDFYAKPSQRAQMRRKVDRSGVATNFELKLRRIDGSELDTLHTINARLDSEGRVSGYQGIMRDITEQKLARKALQEARDELQLRVQERTAALAEANARLKAEIAERARAQEALILSEERMRAIFEAATECIFIKNRSLKYTLVNPYMANLLELPAGDIFGRIDEELFGHEAGQHLRQVDQRVLAGETIEEEHTRPVKGLPTTFLDVRSPIRNSKGQIIGICGIS